MKGQISTIGLDNSTQGFQLSDGSIYEVNIMDTGGQERFNCIIKNYYRLADCCLLVYDITSKRTFDKIDDYYIGQLNENTDSIKKVILLGNKTDLKDKRQISTEEGLKLAEKNGYIFMESSCVDNYNVSSAFETLIEMTNAELKKGNCLKIKKNDNNNKKNNKEDIKKKKSFC